MDQYIDWTAFQRLDNAQAVDFLTSVASVLCERGLLTDKDSDNLRLALSGISSVASSRERPILLELEKQGAEFLATLLARYGRSGLCLNLLRHTMRQPVEELRQSLAQWGQLLVKKSELLFNRSFYVYDGGICEKECPYSSVIVDFTETLAQSCEAFDDCLTALQQINPHAMASGASDHMDVDQAIGKALGFSGLVRRTITGQAESALIRRLTFFLQEVAHASGSFAAQLSANTNSQEAYGVAAACDSLTAECQRLGQLELPFSASLMIWEMRRRSIIAALAAINQAIKTLAAASLECLAQEVKQPLASTTEAVKRCMTFDLITHGASPAQAADATAALLRYLAENKLQAKQLLAGELARIHPALTPASLETLVKLAADTNIMSAATTEKSHTAGRARRLSETFSKTLARGAAALVLFFVMLLPLGGCGLKMPPTSDVPELRPDISFKPLPAAAPLSSSATEQTGLKQKAQEP